jgi:hypothetical protein
MVDGVSAMREMSLIMKYVQVTNEALILANARKHDIAGSQLAVAEGINPLNHTLQSVILFSRHSDLRQLATQSVSAADSDIISRMTASKTARLQLPQVANQGWNRNAGVCLNF